MSQPKIWPDKNLEYIKNPIYSDKQLKQELLIIAKKKLDGFNKQLYGDKDLIIVSYNPSEASNKVKIKSLKDLPNHPAYPHFGLYSKQSLKPHTLVLKYCGLITTDENYDKTSDYVLTLLNNYSIDANKKGNEARYVNDYRNIAPGPNVEFKEFYDKNTGEMSMGIFALKEVIPPNTELLINYGKAFWKARNLLS